MTSDRLSPAELVRLHAPNLCVSGAAVEVCFPDPSVAFAFYRGLQAARDGDDAPAPTSALDALARRIAVLELVVGRLSAEGSADPGLPHLRDMGLTLLDKARARLMEARAEEVEQRVRAEYGPPPDDGANPVLVERWRVDGRSDERLVRTALTDRRGRDYALTQPPDHARQLAEGLLSAARFAEKEGA